MSALSFCFESNQVRVLGTIVNPLFVALDICKALGYQNHKDAVARHVDPEDISKQEITDNMGRKQEVNCVNESGMYALIFGSKLPSAKRFKKWVTSEVLPAIRKTGQYSTADKMKAVATLTPEQQFELKEAVKRKAKTAPTHYQTIYRAIYARYKIARYEQLPADKLADCISFINTIDLRVPAMPITQKSEARCLTDAELSSLAKLHGLHKDPYFAIAYKVAYDTLRVAQSKLAGRFYDVMTEPALALLRIEKILERNGIEHC